MNGKSHVVNLEYGPCIVYRYKTHIHYSDNKMNEYFRFSTKSTTQAESDTNFKTEQLP